jgi:TonB-linked SusC/RagA family outer membrane protein
MNKLKTCALFVLLLLLPVNFTPVMAQQKQSFILEGTVYDETGATLEGTVLYIKDKINIGTSADTDGKFRIKASKGDIIVFTFLGYENVEYVVSEEKKDLQIRFSESSQQLDEVVVVGLGQQRKISSVAAVSTIDVKELQTPAPSIANLLGGKIAGVISMQNSGEPGKNLAEFWVRGIGTFGANASALVLIDGLEGDINSIDAADIESFSVLKDASATAVYGVRGANGVVLITTKRGTEGKLNITARTNLSLSHLVRVPDYLQAYDYATLANEANEVRGDSPLYSNRELNIIRSKLDPDIYPDVDWQDEILNRNSLKRSYFLSARGGGSVARYYLSLGMTDETAAYKQDKSSVYSSNVGYNTYNYRLNLDMNLTSTTVVYFGVDGYQSVLKEPGVANTDYIWQAQSRITPVLFPTVFSNGMYPAVGINSESSPYVLINQTGNKSSSNYQGKATMSISQNLSMLLDGLKLRVQGAYDLTSRFAETRYVQPSLYSALGRRYDGQLIMREMVQSRPAAYTKTQGQYRKYHFESTLSYDKLFGTDHRVSGLIYYYLSDQQDSDNATASLEAIPLRYQGVSSRLTYSFRDTYLLDVNFGYTGSENFQPGRQYGFFPSIALGWVPSSYSFVKENLTWLDFLKIRGSYGSVGNDRLAGNRRFPYLTKIKMATTYKPFGSAGVETVTEDVIGADNLAWEKAIKSNLGVEGRLLKDRIAFTVDFFSDQRDGIFQERVQVPDLVGLTTMPFGNVGKMRSYGSDGNVSYSQGIGKDINFTVRGNFTYSKNDVQNWEQMYEKYSYLERTGLPHNVLRGYQSLGFFKDNDDILYSPKQSWGTVQPGDLKYRDVNFDGKIDADDMVPLSYNTYPLLMFGMGGEFRYKDLTFGILFKGTGQTDFFHVGQDGNGMGYVPFYGGLQGNVLSFVNDPANRWIPMDYALAHGIDPALAENPNARFPKMQYGRNENNSQLSDFWKGDARYLRLQEITLNYNLRLNALRKVGISSVDIQLVGNNLYCWDKVHTFDPEQATANGQAYPIPRIYTLQLYINF